MSMNKTCAISSWISDDKLSAISRFSYLRRQQLTSLNRSSAKQYLRSFRFVLYDNLKSDKIFSSQSVTRKLARPRFRDEDKMKILTFLILCFASVALAEDFKAIDGKEYKNVTVS